MSTPIEEGRRRAGLLVFVALLIAGGTATVAYKVVDRYQTRLEEAESPVGQVTVMVATRDLAAGMPIGTDDVEQVNIPRDLLPEGGTFRQVADLLGRIPGDPILKGELIRSERLLGGGAVMNVDAAIEPGTRALTILVDKAASVGGLLEPGFFVDIIVTIRPDSKTLDADWVTETVLQGVRVVAVNDRLIGQADDENVEEEGRRRQVFVTLEVDPYEAEKVALASARGELVLSLRHAEDDVILENTEGPLVTNALVGLTDQRKVAVPTSRPRRARVVKTDAAVPTQKAEIVSGSKVSVEEFDDKGQRVNQKP
jgi:pilus assembly protein CpaB